jgi:lambda family phage portal protein
MQAMENAGLVSAVSGYPVPGDERKTMRGFDASANHVDADTLPILQQSRAGSRDMWMNTPIAIAALKRVRTNVVGYGLSLQSTIDRGFLGLTDEEADAWEDNVEREFALWAQSKECDVRRTSTFEDLQAVALMSTLMSGDCFVLLPSVKRPNMPYDLRVQLLEADFVCNPPTQEETNSFAGGIQNDQWGAPTKYWVKYFPQNLSIYASAFIGFNSMLGDWKGIPAFGAKTGRRNVLHLFEVDRPGQRRGVPFLAPILETLKQLTRLSEAELMAAVVTSYLTVFVKDVPGQLPFNTGYLPGMSPLDPATQPGGSGVATASRPQDANKLVLGSGSIGMLDKNQEVQVVDPTRPNALFDNFFTAICKQIGAATEVPYEQLLLVFGSSYSASRAALLEAWKFYRKWRAWMARNFCNPIYQEFLTEAVLKGRISAPGFFDDPAIRAAWCGAEWNGAGQGQIDPLKETQAALGRIGGNLSSHEQEAVAIDGRDWVSTVTRLGREKKKIEKLGLTMTTGQEKPVPEPPDDEDGPIKPAKKKEKS